jgi:hypothetical protein
VLARGAGEGGAGERQDKRAETGEVKEGGGEKVERRKVIKKELEEIDPGRERVEGNG